MNYTEFFQFLKNWFDYSRIFGRFQISKNGEITMIDGGTDMAALLSSDQFIRVIGSKFNDGVWRYPLSSGRAEEFDGAVWAMAVPPALVELAAEIDSYNSKNKDALDSPFASESFGGYSYSKENGGAAGWRDHFAARLTPWRKL